MGCQNDKDTGNPERKPSKDITPERKPSKDITPIRKPSEQVRHQKSTEVKPADLYAEGEDAGDKIWIFGNPSNPKILEVDLENVYQATCRNHKFESDFKPLYHMSYLRLNSSQVLAFGGSKKKGGTPTNNVWKLTLNKATDTGVYKVRCEEFSDMTVGRNDPAILDYHDKIFVCGGFNQDGPLKTLEFLVKDEDVFKPLEPDMWDSKKNFLFQGHNHKLHIFDKWNSEKRNFDVLMLPKKSEKENTVRTWVYNNGDDEEEEEEDEEEDRGRCQNAACIKINHSDFLMVGGQDGNNKSDLMMQVDMDMQTVIKLDKTLLKAQSPCFMKKHKNKIFIIGGVDESCKHKDMFSKVEIKFQGEFVPKPIKNIGVISNFLKENKVPETLLDHKIV